MHWERRRILRDYDPASDMTEAGCRTTSTSSVTRSRPPTAAGAHADPGRGGVGGPAFLLRGEERVTDRCGDGQLVTAVPRLGWATKGSLPTAGPRGRCRGRRRRGATPSGAWRTGHASCSAPRLSGMPGRRRLQDALPEDALVTWRSRRGTRPGDEQAVEHPPADVTVGMGAVDPAVDAIVMGGGWTETVFLLTWGDWGGWDDHVASPNVEQAAGGVQVPFGPRVPLLMFGGAVPPWSTPAGAHTCPFPRPRCSWLPALGVPRVDDPGLADLVTTTVSIPPPPAPRWQRRRRQPVRRTRSRPPRACASPPPEVVLRAGRTTPARNDVTLKACPDGCSSLRERDVYPDGAPKVVVAAGPPGRHVRRGGGVQDAPETATVWRILTSSGN